jgi:hypothetical protein
MFDKEVDPQHWFLQMIQNKVTPDQIRNQRQLLSLKMRRLRVEISGLQQELDRVQAKCKHVTGHKLVEGSCVHCGWDLGDDS